MLELIDGREQSTAVPIQRPRPVRGAEDVEAMVGAIVDDVRLRGDDAVLEHTRKLDGANLTPETIRVDEAEIDKARALVRPELVDALEVMAARLRRTSEHQLPQPWMEEDAGEFVGELIRPLRRVGIYVPGGRGTYPSSVVMAAIPATVAGVEAMALCTPPDAGGRVAEAVLAACAVAGVTEVYRIGGAQAIAALAFGTETVRPVEKIVGPGNVYVTASKRLVAGWVGTDSQAGPTEIAIVADDTAEPKVLAADLIAQAEHGPLGTHALITWVPALAEATMAALESELPRHRRYDDVENALIEGGVAVLVRDAKQAIDTANLLAPEHLQLVFTGAFDALDDIRNAGSVFVGPHSAVPVGDYSGSTNHVLPSGGAARWSSGLGVPDFVKRIFVSGVERSALERLAPHIEALADAEGFDGHARAIELRVNDRAAGL